MTETHKLKKAIRARAKKTGERYTAARRNVLAARARPAAAPTTPARASRPASPAGVQARKPPRKTALGSVSDQKARENTGHGLDHWFAVLDAFGAPQKGHTAAARHLYEAHGIPGWYCQGITVAYERARGLRGVNQSGAGGFQVSVSRVVPAGVAEVIDAVRSPERRKVWLAGGDPELIRALSTGLQSEKAKAFGVRARGDARLRFKWGKGTVEIYIQPRPKGKASITAANTDLPETDAVEPRRAAWGLVLDGLRRHLTR